MGLSSRDYYRPSGLGGFSFFPPVIKYILIANGIVFVLQLISNMIIYGYTINGYAVSYEYLLTKYFALNPLFNSEGTGDFYIWQLFTYQFMHGNFTHILFNMFMLWMFGMELENIMGSKKFLLYYLLCGFGAGLFQLFLSPLFTGSMGPTIGASGAVFGVMIAFAMFFPDRYIFLYFLIPIKAKYLIAFLIIIEFMSVKEPTLIAHLAHIGGALTGFVFILLDRKNNFNVDKLFGSLKKSNPFSQSGKFRSSGFGGTIRGTDIEEAKYYDINNSSKDNEKVTQDEIDRILDKISQSGYQNLTEREKRILFEASKKN